MDKRIRWTPNYDFLMLSMMQEFTDAELTGFGMSPEVITKYREFVKRQEEEAGRREGDHD